MMLVAAIGVVMNGVIAALLWKCSGDVNIRSVFLHMLGDTLSTAAVIAGGAGIYFTGMYWIDPVLSLAIAGMVLWSAVGVVRETLNILLEGTPRGLRLAQVREAMLAVGGVLDVHDLHVWSLGSHSHALASHILVEDAPVSESALDPRPRELHAARPLPHPPHHHPGGDHGLRDHARLLRAAGVGRGDGPCAPSPPWTRPRPRALAPARTLGRASRKGWHLRHKQRRILEPSQWSNIQ